MKVCKRCNVAKDERNFYTDARTKDGLRGKCNECMEALERERRAALYGRGRCDPAPREAVPRDWEGFIRLSSEAVSVRFSGPLTRAQAERFRRIVAVYTQGDRNGLTAQSAD